MSYQRTRAEIENRALKSGEGGQIVVTIDYTGKTDGQQDTLALVADAWHQAMFDAGLDPIRGIQDVSAFKAKNLPGHGAPKAPDPNPTTDPTA